MSKPIVFLSHASIDKDVLAHLHKLLQKKCSNAVNFFMSSDGQSIPFGSNWVYTMEKSLKECDLLLAFISPNSVKSQWLLFEMGVAYSKNTKVIPIGILGIDLAKLPPPISLLQGFNLSSADGLNNIIMIINNKFQFEFSYFSAEEYREIFSTSLPFPMTLWGVHCQYIYELCIMISKEKLISTDINEIRPILNQMLIEYGIQGSGSGPSLEGCGFSVLMTSDYPSPENIFKDIVIRIDPYALEIVYHFVEDILGKICTSASDKPSTIIVFNELVNNLKGTHRIAARVYGLGMLLTKTGQLSYKNIEFVIPEHKRTQTTISYKVMPDGFFASTILMIEILDILFKRSVLYIESESGINYETYLDEY